MTDIIYIDRLTGQKKVEKVYKGKALSLLYGDKWYNRLLGCALLPLVAKRSLFSSLYGFLQKRPFSAKKINPFIKTFEVDASEFLEPVSQFRSFNDFFIRRLQPKARPLAAGDDIAVMPADGRYYFYQDIDQCEGFIVKGKKFDLSALLGSETLAQAYSGASMVMARLCPSDYHRFHFPCDCRPGQTALINGHFYSVNPLAVKKNLHIFTENKRTLCELETRAFGRVLYLEIGATNVGSIQETYTPFKWHVKGEEKGYFEFGGSSLILLFPKGAIQFDADLLEATQQGFEMRCLMGQRMGRRLISPNHLL
ncbi:archaetidylserine decarboxylase [Candidatus Protochlamydia phocaeensis]|uniref:archaetidylserine decarboxylase n=1 Tax=Candidatus Protochlamydia phocaeensis TaxID=1414722 RepID=UPI0008387FFF|nr:archaetidylserine decarboxylase [Candidatus Protochlamydia phocaeensis]